jgi:hypothetical protein
MVVTHLKSLETRKNPEDRCSWKIRLTKGLLDSGKDPEYIRLLRKFIDWMIDLPPELTARFENEIETYEKEKKMEYITTFERRGIEKGRAGGREEGGKLLVRQFLEKRFGPLTEKIKTKLDQWPNNQLADLLEGLTQNKSLKEVGLED